MIIRDLLDSYFFDKEEDIEREIDNIRSLTGEQLKEFLLEILEESLISLKDYKENPDAYSSPIIL